MAASTEARSPRQAAAVIGIPDTRKIHLGVAAQTKVVITDFQHLVVNRTVHLVTCGAAFTDGLVLKDERTALFLVTLKTLAVDPVE